MSDHIPTTGKVRKIWKAWHYRFNFESYEDSAERFDAWLAEHDAEVAAKAWDEGYWQGINGHTGPGNPYRDSDAAEYRERGSE